MVSPSLCEGFQAFKRGFDYFAATMRFTGESLTNTFTNAALADKIGPPPGHFLAARQSLLEWPVAAICFPLNGFGERAVRDAPGLLPSASGSFPGNSARLARAGDWHRLVSYGSRGFISLRSSGNLDF